MRYKVLERRTGSMIRSDTLGDGIALGEERGDSQG